MREILIAVAKGQELVLSIPAPLVLFNEFADWALKFQLICFVDDVEMAARVKSEMNFDLLRRLKEGGVRIAYPYPTPVAAVSPESAQAAGDRRRLRRRRRAPQWN